MFQWPHAAVIKGWVNESKFKLRNSSLEIELSYIYTKTLSQIVSVYMLKSDFAEKN